MTKPAEKKPANSSPKTSPPTMLGGLILDSGATPPPSPAPEASAMQPAASAKAATEKKAPAAHPKPESPAVNKAAPPDKASVGDRKRRTIYFTEDVDKRLRLYVAAEDAEMSAVVTQAVEEFLNRQQGRA